MAMALFYSCVRCNEGMNCAVGAESAYNALPPPRQGTRLMKTAAYLLGALLIVIAAIYLLVPADSLPSFFPGHEAGLARVRVKHGLVAGAAGIALFAIGWLVGRRA
jgi:hypothetical protein